MKQVILPALAAAVLAACGPSEPAETAHPVAPPSGPDVAAPLPAPPGWAQGYIGKVLTEVLPQSEACQGNTDGFLHRYAGPPGGVAVAGWGWDTARSRRIERILLADESLRIVGAAEGGTPRADVSRAQPQITDPNTGWTGAAPIAAGDVVAYGLVDDGRALCSLGTITV